jgi:uncharacterized protein (DUF1697 family)
VPNYVAFLRAINVGGTAVVKMDALRGMFEDAGFTNVRTVIASGNVLFESAASRSAVTKTIERVGFTSFVRTHAEVQRIAELTPFPDMSAEGNVLYVAFLEKKPAAEAEKKLLALANPVDAFHVRGTEAYWLRRRNMGESKLAANFLEKALGQKATVRNVNTIRRIAAMG